MCKNAVKKLPFIIRCVSDQYKTQEMCEMCDTIILQNMGTLMFIYDCYKNKIIFNKAHWQLCSFIRVCPWIKKMYNKAVDTYLSAMHLYAWPI